MSPLVPRPVSAVLAAAVVAAGLGSRALLPGAIGGPVGDALYATLVVILVTLARPTTTALVAAAVGLALCTGIELFQLTGIPVAVAEHLPPARLVLGTTFWAPDLLRYTAGAALGWLLLRGYLGVVRRTGRRTTRGPSRATS